MPEKSNKKYRIAIDAMGSDFAPDSEIQGAIALFDEAKQKEQLEIILVGNEDLIREALKKFNAQTFPCSIIHSPETITMHDDPTLSLKKKNSSIYMGLELVKNGKADAFVSSGNTGAVMSNATVILGRLKGVSRPTIGSFFPTEHDNPTFVLDVGATIDSKPRFLYEFAVMGTVFIRQILGIKEPKVGLLNVGEEDTKGTEVIRETYKLLEESELNFVGNLEGRDILKGSADVVVCDGFTGNIVLKVAESFVSFMKARIKSFAAKSLINKLSAAVVVPFLKKIILKFDYQEYGGVQLLGVNGVVIIGHGKSTPKAIRNMLLKAVESLKNDVNGLIEQSLSGKS